MKRRKEEKKNRRREEEIKECIKEGARSRNWTGSIFKRRSNHQISKTKMKRVCEYKKEN
jgi:hypothetical protein